MPSEKQHLAESIFHERKTQTIITDRPNHQSAYNLNTMHRYFPHTQADIDAMLAACGMTDAGQLSADVPEAIRFSGDYDLLQRISRWHALLEQACMTITHQL